MNHPQKTSHLNSQRFSKRTFRLSLDQSQQKNNIWIDRNFNSLTSHVTLIFGVILLMEEILHQLIGSLSQYLWVLYMPGGCLGFLPPTACKNQCTVSRGVDNIGPFSQLSACHKLYRNPNKTRHGCCMFSVFFIYMLFCFRDKKNRGLSQRCVYFCFVWFFPRFKRSCLEPYGKNLKSKTCQVSTCHWTAARRHPWQTRRSPGKIGLVANVYLVGGWTNPSEKY